MSLGFSGNSKQSSYGLQSKPSGGSGSSSNRASVPRPPPSASTATRGAPQKKTIVTSSGSGSRSSSSSGSLKSTSFSVISSDSSSSARQQQQHQRFDSSKYMEAPPMFSAVPETPQMAEYKARLLERKKMRLAATASAKKKAAGAAAAVAAAAAAGEATSSFRAVEGGGNVPNTAGPVFQQMEAEKKKFEQSQKIEHSKTPLGIAERAEANSVAVKTEVTELRDIVRKLTQQLEDHVVGKAAVESHQKEKKAMELRFADLTMAIRTENIEKGKLQVTIKALQSELSELRKTTGNPVGVQDELQRTVKQTEKVLQEQILDYRQECDDSINALIRTIDARHTEQDAAIKAAMTAAVYSVYATVVADEGLPLHLLATAPMKTQDVVDFVELNAAAAAACATIPKGSRVILYYPMRKCPVTNDIWMETKFVNPVSAEVSHCLARVCVYNAESSGVYTVDSFSV